MARKRNSVKAGFFQFCPVFGKKQDNLGKVQDACRNLDIALLVLPEFFATGYQFRSQKEVAMLSEKIPEGETTAALMELARNSSCYIIAGLPEKDDKAYFNSSVFVGPYGYIGTYRKTHLFFEEKKYFAPGNTGFQVWETDIACIGMMICFDWFFPESMRILALKGADIIGHPSNLVLPYCPAAMPIRCLENKVFTVTANRTGRETRKKGHILHFIGQSLIAAPGGETLIRASEDTEMLGVAELDRMLARNKSINSRNNIFSDRRPEMYSTLTDRQ